MTGELQWVTQSQVADFAAVKSIAVILTDAQIKALPLTPLVIIPATEILDGSGFPSSLPQIISASAMLNAQAGAYDGITDGTLFLAYGANGSGPTVATATALQTPLGVAEKSMAIFGVQNNNTFEQDNFPDNGLGIVMGNDDELTGGNSANTMTITVCYLVLNL